MAMTHIISLIDSIFIGKKQKCHVSSQQLRFQPSGASLNKTHNDNVPGGSSQASGAGGSWKQEAG